MNEAQKEFLTSVMDQLDAAKAEIDRLRATSATLTGELEAARAEVERLKARCEKWHEEYGRWLLEDCDPKLRGEEAVLREERDSARADLVAETREHNYIVERMATLWFILTRETTMPDERATEERANRIMADLAAATKIVEAAKRWAFVCHAGCTAAVCEECASHHTAYSILRGSGPKVKS